MFLQSFIFLQKFRISIRPKVIQNDQWNWEWIGGTLTGRHEVTTFNARVNAYLWHWGRAVVHNCWMCHFYLGRIDEIFSDVRLFLYMYNNQEQWQAAAWPAQASKATKVKVIRTVIIKFCRKCKWVINNHSHTFCCALAILVHFFKIIWHSKNPEKNVQMSGKREMANLDDSVIVEENHAKHLCRSVNCIDATVTNITPMNDFIGTFLVSLNQYFTFLSM